MGRKSVSPRLLGPNSRVERRAMGKAVYAVQRVHGGLLKV